MDKTRKTVNKNVSEKLKFVEGRDTTVNVYGGSLKEDTEGNLIYDMRLLSKRGINNFVDQKGDARVRSLDDHIIKRPLKTLLNHPRAFIHAAFGTGKRFREFNPQRLAEHFKKFGLEDDYEAHSSGIKIKNPDIIKKGYNLQDIYRMPELGIDRIPPQQKLQIIYVNCMIKLMLV